MIAKVRIAVYCGSAPGADPSFVAAARALGTAIARRGWGVVYGGASIGLMGAVADACLAAGGEVIGVLPRALFAREIGHQGLHELHLVETMHERKAKMADVANAFVALPGGFGTLDELFEVLTWAQIGLHRKPCAVLDVKGYYTGLLSFLDHAESSGFLATPHRRSLLRFEEPSELLDHVATHAATGFDGAIV